MSVDNTSRSRRTKLCRDSCERFLRVSLLLLQHFLYNTPCALQSVNKEVSQVVQVRMMLMVLSVVGAGSAGAVGAGSAGAGADGAVCRCIYGCVVGGWLEMALRRSIALLEQQESGLMGALGRWARSASGYRKYGLFAEDLIREEIPGVKEALSRLPQAEQDERYFRLKRAMQLSMQHKYLPKEQWTTDETEKQYLSPILRQVRQELNEKQEFDQQL
eukprot:gene9130-1429_t